jgi:uncharacterized membrane protein YhaH (DUF805 family)
MSEYTSYTGGPETPQAQGPVDIMQPLRGASFGDAVQRFFKKYAVFSGRASRSEFWYWALAAFIIGVILSALRSVSGVFWIIDILWNLAVLVPSFALGARRLHDTGKSGWWQLLAIIPVIGWIILIVWYATAPTPAGEKYNVA